MNTLKLVKADLEKSKFIAPNFSPLRPGTMNHMLPIDSVPDETPGITMQFG